jgi:hypothetical protein
LTYFDFQAIAKEELLIVKCDMKSAKAKGGCWKPGKTQAVGSVQGPKSFQTGCGRLKKKEDF